MTEVMVYRCNALVYNTCTLFKKKDYGIAVIQQRFNSDMKITWWGPIDLDLQQAILKNEKFNAFFNQEATKMDGTGCYHTFEIRKLMWRLGMKPISKEYWETKF